MRKKMGIVLPLILWSFQIMAQSDNLTARPEAHINRGATEKTYLHTDKDLYIKGDTIWFKTYLLDGRSHTASDKSNVVHVELLDPHDNVIAKRKLYIKGSSAFGDIAIDGSAEEGEYRIRAYTLYMLNDENIALFHKKISVRARPLPEKATPYAPLSKNMEERVNVPSLPIKKPNLQFFPEGGHLVAGLHSGLGLKITDGSGNGIALKGIITDQNGIVVAPFETHEFGLGMVEIAPKTGIEYYAEINFNGIPHTYPLPTALKDGYVIQLKNQGSRLIIKVSTNLGQGLTGTTLLGHLRGKTFFEHTTEEGGKKSYILKVPTAGLSDGVARFTLFDGQGIPICERLAFIDNPENDTEAVLKTDKAGYGLRERVQMDVSLFHDNEEPLQGDLSFSVSLDKDLDRNAPHIKSWILLSSDMGDTVEDPYYFFGEDAHKRKGLLDLLMLTHGWRRFVWNPFPMNGFDRAAEFLPEKGIMIHGRTTSFHNRDQPRTALATLNVLGQEIYQENVRTDAQGRFSFGPLVLIDSVKVILTASALERDKRSNAKIAAHINPSPSKINRDSLIGQRSPKNNVLSQREHTREYGNIVGGFPYDANTIELSEAVVQARKKTKKEHIEEELNKLTMHGSAQNRLFPDSIPGLRASSTIFDLLRQVAGIRITGTFPDQSVQIRGISTFGSSDPLFTMDGVPVPDDFIQSMPVTDVLFVDVLKGNEAAIYGVRGANGVVAIYTKRGINYEDVQEEEYPGVAHFVVHGFYRAREFYAPDHSIDKPRYRLPDYRTTLYWNPDVKIVGKEKTRLSFYTGDVAGKYTARIEGITDSGRPISRQYSFYVLD